MGETEVARRIKAGGAGRSEGYSSGKSESVNKLAEFQATLYPSMWDVC